MTQTTTMKTMKTKMTRTFYSSLMPIRLVEAARQPLAPEPEFVPARQPLAPESVPVPLAQNAASNSIQAHFRFRLAGRFDAQLRHQLPFANQTQHHANCEAEVSWHQQNGPIECGRLEIALRTLPFARLAFASLQGLLSVRLPQSKPSSIAAS